MPEVEEYKISTGSLGSIISQQNEPVIEQAVEQPAQETVQVAAAPETTTTEPVVEAPVQPNDVGTFNIPTAEKKVEQVAAAPVEVDWRQALKKADRKEVLKEAGLDDFDIQLIDYRKAKGDLTPFLEAKTKDWTKVSDLEVLRDQIKREYGMLSPEDQELLFQNKIIKQYNLTDLATEDEQAFGKVLVRAEAEKIRQARIAEAQNFIIPEPAAVDTSAQQQAQAAQAAAFKQSIIDNPATQSLFQSKRVVADGGDGLKFNFEIDNPQELANMILDGETYQRHTTNERGEPDLNKMYLMGLMAINPNQFVKSLINYGKSLGVKTTVEEGQNISREQVRPPVSSNLTEGQAWGQAKTGTIGTKY